MPHSNFLLIIDTNPLQVCPSYWQLKSAIDTNLQACLPVFRFLKATTARQGNVLGITLIKNHEYIPYRPTHSLLKYLVPVCDSG